MMKTITLTICLLIAPLTLASDCQERLKLPNDSLLFITKVTKDAIFEIAGECQKSEASDTWECVSAHLQHIAEGTDFIAPDARKALGY